MRSLLALAALLLPACSALPRRPIPAEQIDHAAVPGYTDIRSFGDVADERLVHRFVASIERERAALGLAVDGALPPAHFLALSGGGANGAFGAGLLAGWSERGDRPEWKIVTGVSTGALIAPFAFLGPRYDAVLKELYTTLSTRDLVQERSVLSALLSEAFEETDGLRQLLERHVDEAMLAEVAREYARGRLLILATTHMDAERPMLWSMGRIAASGRPDACELFRDVMVASAAIPGAFPPVLIDVEADGERYDEMHCDGGVTSQVFLYPPAFSFADLSDRAMAQRERHLYVIRNAKLRPDYVAVERRTLPIAARAVATLVKTQGVGDLYRIFLGCERDQIDFNLASIPESFVAKPAEFFDPAYMSALYEVGRAWACDGAPWQKSPPGFHPPAPAEAHAGSAPR
ncbi:MAG: patatin-like phospholipase family protein [Planctomycetes bacterium]|nr:patatin-like phospholipase family protein [Planctomycetota bacterium]